MTVAALEAASVEGSTTTLPPGQPRPDAGVRLLAVDDNSSIRKWLFGCSSTKGHRVDVAANGKHAIEAVGLVRYAAVLMDCQMPTMDGYEAARAIRALEGPDRHTPIRHHGR